MSIRVLEGKRHGGDQLHVKLILDWVDINNTNYRVVGTYVTTTVNRTMNIVTSQLYVIVEDKPDQPNCIEVTQKMLDL